MDQYPLPSDETEIYRHMVESARDYAIFAMDRDGTVVTWSAGAEGLFGYSPPEIIGQNSAILFSFEDQLAAAPLKEIRLALTTGRADDSRWHVRKDGGSFWASGLTMPLRNDLGEIYGLMKIVRDRTRMLHEEEALRASQERLQLILKSAIDYAIFAFDRDRRIISWNTGACRIFGYEEDEIIGRDARILLAPEDRDEETLEREMKAAAEHGRAETERFHLRKDGSTFWGSGLTMPLRAQRAGYLTVLRDETERHFAEEHQQIMLREMSHRVKNSLALVAAMLAMQARSAKQEEVGQALRDAEARVGTIAEVHDQLWRQPHTETVDLAEFLSSLCQRLQQSTSSHILSVDADPCIVDADRAIQIALLVNELVTNAFKHAYADADAAGAVTVSVRSIGNEIRLEVADSGKGLPPEVSSAENGGKSLGMKIVRALLQQLRAELHIADRQPGTGFVIRLPREG